MHNSPVITCFGATLLILSIFSTVVDTNLIVPLKDTPLYKVYIRNARAAPCTDPTAENSK